MNRKERKLDKRFFLEKYRLSDEEFAQAQIDWGTLETIYEIHSGSLRELQDLGDYIMKRLSLLRDVHSLKVRVKHPEHLIEKIIRKMIEKPEVVITAENYREIVTDLVGVRALHLFKGQWQPIHEFVTETWDLHETPFAYVRKGDSDEVLDSFKKLGCDVETHPNGYRSVHYLIELKPTKTIQIAELQVRTLFEEAWSEIDHLVRYPRLSDNPQLVEFLTIFNRLAGSADEMGTFIKNLSHFIEAQNAQLTEAESQLEAKESDLKKAISQLSITNAEKKKLEAQVSELRKSSKKFQVDILGSQRISPDPTGPITLTVPNLLANSWLPDSAFVLRSQPTCSKCGRKFQDDYFDGYLTVEADKCPDCRKSIGT